MQVKFKRLYKDAVMPMRAHKGDAGLDLVAHSLASDDNGNIVYGTGVAVEIPEGYVGLVFPRSSICKYTMALTNSVGVIDSGYRGEIMAKFKRTYSHEYNSYKVGEKIAQLIIIPYPEIEIVEAEELSASERGAYGYGSSGR